MTANFLLNNLFTYRDARLRGSRLLTGLLTFYAACAVGSAINLSVSGDLLRHGLPWVLSGLAGLAISSVWNYGVTSVTTWRAKRRSRRILKHDITRSRLPVLDGWRAIAISLVVWHHATMSRLCGSGSLLGQQCSQLGAFGVDIFFGLSGLLITTLLLQEYQRKGSISLPGFYTRRVFRILPPVFALLLVLSCLGLIQSPLELASCLGFFRNYLPDTAGSYTRHLWSLGGGGTLLSALAGIPGVDLPLS